MYSQQSYVGCVFGMTAKSKWLFNGLVTGVASTFGLILSIIRTVTVLPFL